MTIKCVGQQHTASKSSTSSINSEQSKGSSIRHQARAGAGNNKYCSSTADTAAKRTEDPITNKVVRL